MVEQVACFLTLTFDEAHVPADGGLHYSFMQEFYRRCRKAGFPLRYYTVGEYGTKAGHPWMNADFDFSLGRPHFHMACFGQDFRFDRVPCARSGSGKLVYESPTLTRLWGNGHVGIGDLTPQSIAYVAKHNFKRVTGRDAPEHYSRVDVVSGEIVYVMPEFARMSLKPGIGSSWLDKFGESDVFAHHHVRIDGHRVSMPRYYDKRFEQLHPLEWEAAGYERYLFALAHESDRTPERLKVIEECKLRKVADGKKRRGGVF